MIALGSDHLQDKELVLELIELGTHPIHKVPTYFFCMRHSVSGEEMGRINLRVASSAHIERYAGHVGYSVEEAYRGNRYASRALRLLMQLARRLDVSELWITCDPENVASRRTCELAGAVLVEIVDVPENCIIHRSGHTRKCRFLLTT